MSKQFVDKIVAEIVAKGNTAAVYSSVRARLDNKGTHVVKLYKSSLKHYDKSIDIDSVYNEIRSRLQKDSNIILSDKSDETKLIVEMPGKYSKNFRIIVESVLGKEAHFAHTGSTTVGISALAEAQDQTLSNIREKSKNVSIGENVVYDRAAASKAFKDAVNKTLSEIKWGWDSTEKISASKYLKSLTIRGQIVPKSLNRSGSEEYDLSKLKVAKVYKYFEDEFAKNANVSTSIKKLGTESASPSPLKKLGQSILHRLGSLIRGMKTGDFSKPKPSTSKSTINTKKPKKATKTPSVFIKKSKVKEPTVNLRTLIPMINLRLHDQISKNMGSPALNYRTGRFANSAEVLDINNESKTISYTYMKDPYSLFEFPGGSPKLATPQRDPRNTIGKSVREIAYELIREKFQAKRV